MGEEGDGVILVIEAGDDLLKDGGLSVVELGEDNDVRFFYLELSGEQFGGMPGPAGGAGYEAVDMDPGLDNPFGHCGSIFLTAVI